MFPASKPICRTNPRNSTRSPTFETRWVMYVQGTTLHVTLHNQYMQSISSKIVIHVHSDQMVHGVYFREFPCPGSVTLRTYAYTRSGARKLEDSRQYKSQSARPFVSGVRSTHTHTRALQRHKASTMQRTDANKRSVSAQRNKQANIYYQFNSHPTLSLWILPFSSKKDIYFSSTPAFSLIYI